MMTFRSPTTTPTPKAPMVPAERPLRFLAFLALLVVLALSLAGCGRKLWPSPVLSEDAFKLEQVAGERRGTCLIVRARVVGPAENMDGVSLQLAEGGPDKDCPDCPFIPSARIEVDRNSPMLSLNGQALRVQFCGISPAPYRWRLVVRNVLPSMPPVVTPVAALP